jgi:hypothetical protein
METIKKINVEEISNLKLRKCARVGDIVGKHRYVGGQVDWYKDAGDVSDVWYGGYDEVEAVTENLDIVERYVVA